MNGQKVIKVFTYEDECIEKFDKVNNELYEASKNANTYANMLMPILNNIGNVLYVLIAFVGEYGFKLKTTEVRKVDKLWQ